VKLRAKLQSFANEKCARALRRINLVTANGVNIRVNGAQVDGNLARRLHAVRMKRDSGLLRDAADLLDRLNRAELVVDVHHRNQLRVSSNRLPDGLGINNAAAIYRNSRDCELIGRAENRGMFDGRRDNMAASGDSEDREVIGFRSAAGEYDFVVEAVKQRGDLAARLVELGAGGLPVMMDTGGVAENLGHHRQHGFQDFRGHGRRRVVIEIISLHGFL
jgi:hypothetical protein